MISIITVSFQALDHLHSCITSVREAEPNRGDYEYIVVDNASTDGSCELIQNHFPWITLLRNKRNLGFACAVNRGLEMASGDKILLLNPDCRVHKGDIDSLVSFLDGHPRCGAVSPMLLTPDGEPQISYARFPRIIPHLLGLSPIGWILPSAFKDSGFSGIPPTTDERAPSQVDAPAGSCLLIRRDVYNDVGGLDEDFFMYYEDIDWAYRMARAGWDRYYLPSIRVIHDMGASWKSLSEDLQLAHSYDGKYIYFQKRYGLRSARLVRATTLWCARLNVTISRALNSCGLGGDSWRRKLAFNTRLLEVCNRYERWNSGS